MVGTGINRHTGQILDGFPHVVQSIEVIFSTQLGERVMRRHFGSSAPILLGKLMTPATIIQFFTLLTVALELWEPRFRIAKVTPKTTSPEVIRQGHFAFEIEGEYRPRGHLGDPTPEAIRRVSVSLNGNGARATPA